MGIWKEGFCQISKREDFVKLKLSSLGGFLSVYRAPRGKGFFLPWLTFHLWVGKRGFFVKGLFGEEKNWIFGFCSMFLRLGEP